METGGVKKGGGGGNHGKREERKPDWDENKQ